jgi:serine/threonine-protein kinase
VCAAAVADLRCAAGFEQSDPPADTGRVVDAYTGDCVIPGYLPDGAELGTDGSRIAVATDGSGTGRTLEVWNDGGEVWKISSEYEPVAIGGKVYIGNLRLF